VLIIITFFYCIKKCFHLQVAIKQSNTHHRKRGFPRFSGSGKATIKQQSNTSLARSSLQQYDEFETPVSTIECIIMQIVITILQIDRRMSNSE